MARKSVIEKIKKGVGLEDPEVRAYIEERAKKRLARMETYKKIDGMISEVIKEKQNK